MSLRILWLNAFLRSPWFTANLDELGEEVAFPLHGPFGWMDDKNPDEIAKATKIGEQLLNDKNDYDIIAFCEVWDEDCRDVLEGMLRSKYPYYVKKISGKARMELGLGEDSGLMIFSKHKLEKFNTDNVNVGEILRDYGIESHCHHGRCPVYFLQYAARADFDAHAAKGAAMVRISHDSYYYNIIWTHLQYQYPDIQYDQLLSLSKLINVIDDNNSAPIAYGHPFKPDHFKMSNEETYILGDFNISGANITENGEGEGACTGDFSEWYSYFGGNGKLYPMFDVWAWMTSPWDCGKTGGTDRIDYAFANGYNWWNGNLIDFLDEQVSKYEPDHTIVQHITCPIIGQSDHRGLFLDICKPSKGCYPRAATVIEEIRSNDPIFYGHITYVGSMQWYRIDQPGTYTFILPAQFFSSDSLSELAIDVYEKEDLTYPIGPYEGLIRERYRNVSSTEEPQFERVIEVTYHTPKAPFYVRVYSRNRAFPMPKFVGDKTSLPFFEYYFQIHRNSGLSKDDPITIGQNEPLRDLNLELDPNAFGSGGPIWLRLDIGYAKSGLEQDITFHMENYSGENARLEFLDESDQVEDSSPSDSGWTKDPNAPLEILKKIKGPSKNRYLLIQRLKSSQIEFRVKWETNLQFVVGKAIACADEITLFIEDETGWDMWGSDEASIQFFYDSRDVPGFYGYFEEANNGDIFRIDYGFHDPVYAGLPVIGFIKRVIVELSEKDLLMDDKGILDILGLAPGQDPVFMQSNVPVSSGTYQVRYNLTRYKPNLDPDPNTKPY